MFTVRDWKGSVSPIVYGRIISSCCGKR